MINDRLDNPMKLSTPNLHSAGLLSVTQVACLWALVTADLQAAVPKDAPPGPAITQHLFTSPDEAVKALQAATQARDRPAMRSLFGAQIDALLTDDEVQDAHNAKKFAALLAQGCETVKVSDDTVWLELGTNNWPMPIPLVRAEGKWHFDTTAGKEEVINRHIGKDELHAIGVCRSFVLAQRQSASANPDAAGPVGYAQKFKSTPGMRDGLYWAADPGDRPSPFGPLVAEAEVTRGGGNKGDAPHPFHGYYFRLLTRQGRAAPGGKMDYLKRGNLTGGFALLAYPEHWDRSGIMTFIVNQDGKVFERNLGERTSQVAGAMKEYNPDADWGLVPDEGVPDAVLEK